MFSIIQIYKVYHWNRFFSPDRNDILLYCHCEERSNLPDRAKDIV